jgi:hypothetical protein
VLEQEAQAMTIDLTDAIFHDENQAPLGSHQRAGPPFAGTDRAVEAADWRLTFPLILD